MLSNTGWVKATNVVVDPVADPYKSGMDIEVISQTTWKDAESFAQSEGGNLMSIASSQENTWVVNSVLDNPANAVDLANVPVWIGLYDPKSGDDMHHATNFVWADGTPVSYNDWNTATDEPNNDFNNNQSGGEHYATIDWHYAQSGIDEGTWNDTPVDGTGTRGSDQFGGTTTGPYYALVEVPAPAAAAAVIVPEPASPAIAIFGAATTALSRRRRR